MARSHPVRKLQSALNPYSKPRRNDLPFSPSSPPAQRASAANARGYWGLILPLRVMSAYEPQRPRRQYAATAQARMPRTGLTCRSARRLCRQLRTHAEKADDRTIPLHLSVIARRTGNRGRYLSMMRIDRPKGQSSQSGFVFGGVAPLLKRTSVSPGGPGPGLMKHAFRRVGYRRYE